MTIDELVAKLKADGWTVATTPAGNLTFRRAGWFLTYAPKYQRMSVTVRGSKRAGEVANAIAKIGSTITYTRVM